MTKKSRQENSQLHRDMKPRSRLSCAICETVCQSIDPTNTSYRSILRVQMFPFREQTKEFINKKWNYR